MSFVSHDRMQETVGSPFVPQSRTPEFLDSQRLQSFKLEPLLQTLNNYCTFWFLRRSLLIVLIAAIAKIRI